MCVCMFTYMFQLLDLVKYYTKLNVRKQFSGRYVSVIHILVLHIVDFWVVTGNHHYLLCCDLEIQINCPLC